MADLKIELEDVGYLILCIRISHCGEGKKKPHLLGQRTVRDRVHKRRVGGVGDSNNPVEERILRALVNGPEGGSSTLCHSKNVLDIKIGLTAVVGVVGALEGLNYKCR